MKNYMMLGLVAILSASLSIAGYKFFEEEPQAILVRESIPYSSVSFSENNSTARDIENPNFIDAANQARPAVVYITSRRLDHNYFGRETYNDATGSGVIISANGYIATNNHVIENGDKITVTLNDKREYVADVVGIDKNTDLALLKIPETELPHLMFADSDQAQVGEWVLAIGSPFRLQSTVTAGIISAKGRNINIIQSGEYDIESFIQTDAVVNPGNSGGALINITGEILGINTAILTHSGNYEGYSFAVPANLVQKIVRDIKDFGSVQRGLLGVNIGPVNAALAKELKLPNVDGVFVSQVNPGSAANEAGIKSGDVILRVNYKKVNAVAELQEQVAQYRPGETVSVEFFREGKMRIVDVVLKNYINTTDLLGSGSNRIFDDIGMEVRDMTTAEHRVFGTRGVKVIGITRNSKVSETKMEHDYIITKLNNKRVKNVKELTREISSADDEVVFEGFYDKSKELHRYMLER